MACTWEDGYNDARKRAGRSDCDCTDYEDGYSAGRRYNERQAEERAAQEQYEYECWMQAKQEAEIQAAYDRQLQSEYEAYLRSLEPDHDDHTTN